MDKTVILKEGVDFTRSKFVEFLNERFGSKESGKPFNSQDVQQYETNGKLPDQYGGNRIRVLKNGKIGINLLKVIGLKLKNDREREKAVN